MFQALQTTLSLDDLLDLLEIDDYGRSWQDAREANLEAEKRRKEEADG